MEANLFSFKLLSMSTDNIKQLKSFLVSTMESNIQSIDQKITEAIPKLTDHKQTIAYINECYTQKQQQVDNLANFILQFLSSLEDIFQELNFKDKKINDLKKTLIEQSDFMIELQDEIQQHKDKILNAEDYIHWMEEQMQYFDLLSVPNQRPYKQNILSKCKSQKTLNSSKLLLESETSQRRKKIDYERLKYYIETLKDQKNHLIREYNNLADVHQRKVFECQKHSILLDELFDKFKAESTLETLPRIPFERQRQRNPENLDFLKKTFSHKNLTTPSDHDVSISVSALPHDNQIQSFRHITEQSRIGAYPDSIKYYLKQQYDQSFTEGNSVLQSLISDAYSRHNFKMDAAVNTKRVYLVSTSCQTLQQDCANQGQTNVLKRESFAPKIKLSQKSTLDDSRIQNKQIQCEISINLKNFSNHDIKKIDFSRLISQQILGENKQAKGYSTCQRQKKKSSKHLCQHLYCFLTNKVVTERIKKYKYPRKQ